MKGGTSTQLTLKLKMVAQGKASLLLVKQHLLKFPLVYEGVAFCSVVVARVELMALRESVCTRVVVEQAAQLSKQEFQPFSLPRRNHCRNLKAPWLVLWLKMGVGTAACLKDKHREEKHFLLTGLTFLWHCGTLSHFRLSCQDLAWRINHQIVGNL